jgi:hypothetical protein
MVCGVCVLGGWGVGVAWGRLPEARGKRGGQAMAGMRPCVASPKLRELHCPHQPHPLRSTKDAPHPPIFPCYLARYPPPTPPFPWGCSMAMSKTVGRHTCTTLFSTCFLTPSSSQTPNPNSPSCIPPPPHADSRFVITACDDMHVHMYDAEHGTLVEAFSGHESWVLSVSAGWVGGWGG